MPKFETIGVISDVHANYVALEAALEEMARRNVDAIFFLGDYITDGPEPGKTLELVREAMRRWPAALIRGNREQYLIDHQNNPDEIWHSGSTDGALLYTYERLTDEDLCWFRQMPISRSFASVSLCHGSPRLVKELMNVDGTNSQSGEVTEYYLRTMRVPLLLSGHTHRAGMSELRVEKEDSPYGVAYTKRIVNPGSVGLPHNHSSRASCAVLHKDGSLPGGIFLWEPELFEFEYDVDRIVRAYRESELMEMAPLWSAANIRFLQTGHNYIIKFIRRAMELYQDDSLEASLAAGYGNYQGKEPPKMPLFSDIPAEIMERAAKDVGII